MTRSSLSPEEVASAVAMREAGYTITAIAEALDCSVSTIQRYLRKTGATKGSARASLIDEARKRLMDRVNSDDSVRDELARQIADDLAHAALLRHQIALAAEQLVANNLSDAVLVMRAAAAYSTALKNTSDMLRHTLRFDRALDAVTEEALPELRVSELSDEEIVERRTAQIAADALLTAY